MEEICSFWEVLINDPLSLVTITSYRDVLKIIGLTIATSSISYFIIKWISNKIKKLILFLHARSKKVRSNVLLLYPEINKIEIVLHQDKDLFFFKSPSIEQDYESRDTNLNHEEIKTLWDEIQKRLNDAQKNVSSLDCARDKKIYSLIEQLKEIYNITTLTEAIYKINKERRVDTKIGFIGDKYGVWNFELRKDKWGSLYKRSIEEEKPTLCLSVYRTDHFAWHVFKYIYERNREFFKQLIDIIPQTNSKQKCAVLQALSFLFSSIGADVILHGRNGKYHNCFVQGLRSSNVEKDGVPRFHVPVNETLTTTDFNGQGNPTDARDWITRGIEEEVGLNYRELNEKNVDINYHDFSIIYDKGEIGFSCDVGINKINLDKLLFLGPIDRYLESDGIFVIPYRKSGFIHMLIKLIFIEYIVPKKIGITNQVEWSFTAPIYQRFFVRQWALTFGYFRYLIVVGVIIFLCIFFNDCIGVLAPFLFTFLLSCGKFWKQKIDFKHSDNKVRYLAPFIPTNVADYIPSQELKVLQTTGKSYINRNDDPVAEGLFLRIKGYEKKITLNLKDLAVSPDPMCCIRRKDNDKEFPISFYNLEKSQPGVMQCKLYFMYFDIYFSLEHPENNIIFFQKEESGKITFAKLIDDIELSFCKPETIKNLDLDEELYRIYFRDNSEQFNNFLLAKFISL